MQLIMVNLTDQIGIDRQSYHSPIVLTTFLICIFILAWITYNYLEMPVQNLIRKAYKGRRESAVSSEPVR